MFLAVHQGLVTLKIEAWCLRAGVTCAMLNIKYQNAVLSMLLAVHTGLAPLMVEAWYRREVVIRALPTENDHHAGHGMLFAVCRPFAPRSLNVGSLCKTYVRKAYYKRSPCHHGHVACNTKKSFVLRCPMLAAWYMSYASNGWW